MPVARVMALFRRHCGTKAVAVTACPADLDLTASRRGKRFFLHVVNTSLSQASAVKLEVRGMSIRSGRVFEIAAEPFAEIDETRPELFSPTERALPAGGEWSFPAASVSVVEVEGEERRRI